MKDEVQAPQEETPNTYWRWLVESWRYPLGHNLGEKWYGVVTLLGEDIVLFIGLAITINYIANMFDIRLIHHASGFTFWAIVILFCVQIITILCSMFGHLFVFGSTGGFWQCVNKVAQVTNWNFWIVICAFLFLILSLSSGLLGFGEALVWIFYALFSLDSFLLVVCPDPGTEKDDPRSILGCSNLPSNDCCHLCYYLGLSLQHYDQLVEILNKKEAVYFFLLMNIYDILSTGFFYVKKEAIVLSYLKSFFNQFN